MLMERQLFGKKEWDSSITPRWYPIVECRKRELSCQWTSKSDVNTIGINHNYFFYKTDTVIFVILIKNNLRMSTGKINCTTIPFVAYGWTECVLRKNFHDNVTLGNIISRRQLDVAARPEMVK